MKADLRISIKDYHLPLSRLWHGGRNQNRKAGNRGREVSVKWIALTMALS
jgi:hypothetical protein